MGGKGGFRGLVRGVSELRRSYDLESFQSPACLVPPCLANTNILTGSNDIIAVREETGRLVASPFSVQFGKKDIWLYPGVATKSIICRSLEQESTPSRNTDICTTHHPQTQLK